MTENVYAEIPKKNLGQPAAGHSRCSLSRAGPLQDVTRICMVVLKRSREIGVAGPRASDSTFGGRVGQNLTRGHDFLPVRPITILDHHRDRTADGLSMPHAGKKTNLIFLYFHP